MTECATVSPHDAALRAAAGVLHCWTDRAYEPEKVVAIIEDLAGPLTPAVFDGNHESQFVDAVARSFYFLPEDSRVPRAREAVIDIKRSVSAAASTVYRTAPTAQAEVIAHFLNRYLAHRSIDAMASLLEQGGGVLAEQNGQLVGVGIAKVLSDAPQSEYARYVPTVTALPAVGVLELAAVEPDCRRLGVGTELVARRLEWLRDVGASSAVCAALIYPDGSVPAAGPLTANGFVHVADIGQFWLNESIREGYDCARCGNPCNCAASLFVTAL